MSGPRYGDIIAAAQSRAAARAERPPIDYARMDRTYPRHKGALTRALNTKDPELRRERVVMACARAVAEWDAIGCWPDEWSRWQRALDDVFPVFHAPALGDLGGVIG